MIIKITRYILKGFQVLTTGYQLKAARALVGMEQADLAERSGVAVTTIRKMEWKGSETLTSGLDTIKRVQAALEAAGVEFLNHGQPGVRLAKKDS
ncbi:helix-turn-helix transcriptional regulator [Bosea sp. 47.2.35]|uniref:helix-turn-helix domain-containing protein n=1 Tax=Bosea sp. 47.2.35 TaxID=2969304 RepID=UPI00214FC8DB|nr:helix-turn-helix transcriptional regulator [Bosea sp. 47.2.35]MCR4524642.1 helix-turn-helix domain-containing protein [Bosea sp. 47.2.35]